MKRTLSPLAVVVPAFDEAPLIARTLRSIPHAVPVADGSARIDAIYVVDDGSRDATASCAQAVGDPRVQVLQKPRNEGVGCALRDGYETAFAQGAEVVVVMAGDGQMHPDDLPALLAAIEQGADYAKGNRLAYPRAHRHMPTTRWLGNLVLGRLTRLCTGLPIHDSQCGYTALHRRAATRIPLRQLWSGYGYPNDLLAMLAAAGMHVAEVPVRPVYADERSGVRLHHALLVVPWVLLRGLRRRLVAPFRLPREAR